MEHFGLLSQAEEDKLHKLRLLNVEEKPYKRITKRILGSFITQPPSLPLTPLPEDCDNADAIAATDAEKQKKIEEWRHFREDVTLDFAAFEGSIARMQFLLTSNEEERKRYATEKLRILSTMQSVRENTSDLRAQLDSAQRLLALRKVYDDLAEKITSNRLLKPREDQHANLQKLQVEITELEKQSKDYAKTWAERRAQFGRIVDEGTQLRRLIRDEKEEVDRREGMQESNGDESEVKDKISNANSPLPEAESMTPQSQDDGGNLEVEKASGVSGASGAGSPLRQVTNTNKNTQFDEDINMLDEGATESKLAVDRDINMADEGEIEDELEEGEEVT
ncbi:hypothetical protein N7495_008795 [Penicillium taxi]|uniref:uncharacterized protein n=1 Tax=Penicillium taxi TaxID=168475 RepID=UPI002545B755|nr:uncharacterized protein N7495_008795 [Penicillium taxi]KAJ5888754.1 hypothetical protein N7495_008795 [Penicillium taxi]